MQNCLPVDVFSHYKLSYCDHGQISVLLPPLSKREILIHQLLLHGLVHHRVRVVKTVQRKDHLPCSLGIDPDVLKDLGALTISKYKKYKKGILVYVCAYTV